MKTFQLFMCALLCSLIVTLAACSQQAPAPPVVDRTKSPFEPSNNRRITSEFHNTATAQVLATQIVQTEQVQATLSSQSTATAQALAILSTATAETRMTEITAYEYFEPFDQNDLDWREDVEDNPYWQGSITLENGFYTWQVNTANQIFLAWSYFSPVDNLADFDLALQARRVTGPSHEACYGLLFRTSPDGYQDGTYVLSVCDAGYFKVLYYDSELGWETIQDWTQSDAIYPDDWNLLEISARDINFSLTINHQPVMAFSDSRLASGSVAVLIDVYTEQPSQIEFDFFALQAR